MNLLKNFQKKSLAKLRHQTIIFDATELTPLDIDDLIQKHLRLQHPAC